MEGWAAKKPRERAEVLRKAFELIIRDTERFAKLMTIENGKALPDSRAEVAYAAEFFRWYAEEAVRNIGEVSRAPASGARIFVQHKPAGVAVLVTPWNFPAAMATRKIGPALAAGCTVVLKPASETPLTMLALMPVMEEAGVPAGVINVMPSRRPGRWSTRCCKIRACASFRSPARPRSGASSCMQPPKRGQAGDGARRQCAVHRVR